LRGWIAICGHLERFQELQALPSHVDNSVQNVWAGWAQHLGVSQADPDVGKARGSGSLHTAQNIAKC
jgi:hypothetical protein